MRLAQTKLAKAAALLANTNANSSSAQLPSSNRNVTEGEEPLDNRVMAMLLELREKMVEDRIYANAKFGDMQGAQEDLLNEVRQLRNQNEALKDEIIELKTAIDEQFLTPPHCSNDTYAQRASANRTTGLVNSVAKCFDMRPRAHHISETPYLTIDISAVDKESGSKVTPEALRNTVKTELDKSPSTQTVNLRAIIRDLQNIKRYRLLFDTEEDRDLARKKID